MATIRGYQAADREACRSLWVELNRHHRQIYRTESIGAGHDPGDHFDEHLEAVGADNLWVATEEEEVVGLTGLIHQPPDGEVEPVVVAASHRGRGIGRALVDHVVGVARDRSVRLLSVRPVGRNSGAIGFFGEAGFEVIGHIELFMDLVGDREWVAGETIAGREFRV